MHPGSTPGEISFRIFFLVFFFFSFSGDALLRMSLFPRAPVSNLLLRQLPRGLRCARVNADRRTTVRVVLPVAFLSPARHDPRQLAHVDPLLVEPAPNTVPSAPGFLLTPLVGSPAPEVLGHDLAARVRAGPYPDALLDLALDLVVELLVGGHPATST